MQQVENYVLSRLYTDPKSSVRRSAVYDDYVRWTTDTPLSRTEFFIQLKSAAKLILRSRLKSADGVFEGIGVSK